MKRVTAVLRGCGILGVALMLPQFFLEQRIGADLPPAINHPEYFYGFNVVTLAFQFVFLAMAQDPLKYRLFFWPAFVEKFGYLAAVTGLYVSGRVPGIVMGFGVMDGVLGVLLVWCYRQVKRAAP